MVSLPTILKVCLFLEISTTLMNLILKLYSKAVADWRLLQVIQRNLMNLKKSLWGSFAPAQVLLPPFTHVCSPPLSHHRTFCRSLNGRRCQLQHRGLDISNPPSSRFLKPLWISPYIPLNCFCFFPSYPCVDCYSVLFSQKYFFSEAFCFEYNDRDHLHIICLQPSQLSSLDSNNDFQKV